MKRLPSAFTLVEILVVVTIIGMLAAAGSVSYTAFTKNSRDARRKADLEQIRSAIELYRSNVGSYPTNSELTVSCTPTDGIKDISGNTYMNKVPLDPKCPKSSYAYQSDGKTYLLGAAMESGSSSCSAPPNGCVLQCNYCVDAYGQK